MSVRAATPEDLDGITSLLRTADLPSDDLSPQSMKHFFVLTERQTSVGAVGLEIYDDSALLRSLVVAKEARGRGYGAQLVNAAEAYARGLDLRAMYLLTTTAEHFFRARGYVPIDRGRAPEAIKGSTQFSSLCPSTAVVMVKS
jgi:amino-acid N-acetyltransferase